MLNWQPFPPDEPRLRINPDGTLQIGAEDGQIEFAFRHLGYQFKANTRPTESGTLLQISAEVGPLPFSAEGVGVRRATLAVIDASQMMNEARLFVSKHKWIYCIGKAALAPHWQPKDAIEASTRLLLEVKPYLQMLRDVLPQRAPWVH
jgi:hypothetical protein